MKRLLSIGIILLFIGLSISSSTGFNTEKLVQPFSSGNTLYVGGSGPGNYTKIQDAIDEASDGDTVFVYNDSSPYYESLLIKKQINLIGENKDTTIIDGIGENVVIEIIADKTTIFNFSIRNSSGGFYDHAGIRIRSNINKISFCDLYSNSNGLLIESRGNIINDCRIFSNKHYGFYAISDNNTVNNCTISNNEIGIDLILSEKWIISNNKFTNNGIVFSGGSNSPDLVFNKFNHTIENNTINGKPLLYIKNQDNIKLDGELVGQIILLNCSNVELKDLVISKTDTPITIAFGKNVKITNCSLFSNNRNGMIFRYGHNVEISDCKTYYNVERGIVILDSSNCEIKNCFSSYNGDVGICMSPLDRIYRSSKNHLISNCELINNNESGLRIVFFWDKPLIIKNCIFKDNKKHGIDLYEARKITISYCKIESNNGKGINLLDSNKININHNNFINNSQHVNYKSLLFLFLFGRMHFQRNYWDNRVEIGPYEIKGEIFIYQFDPWSEENRKKIRDWTFFDWLPARNPYDIEV